MKRFNITVNGHTYDVQVEELSDAPTSAPTPAPPAAPAPAAPSSMAAAEGAELLNAPMPGTIVNVLVKAGDRVSKGQVLLVLEAMKMENEIMSPRDAAVAGVYVNKGDSVDSGKLLVSLR